MTIVSNKDILNYFYIEFYGRCAHARAAVSSGSQKRPLPKKFNLTPQFKISEFHQNRHFFLTKNKS